MRASIDASASAGPAGTTIRTLDASEALLVPRVWNAAWGHLPQNPYLLSEDLWRERLASRHHDPSLLIGAFAGVDLVGYAHGKLPVSAWQTPHAAYVSSIAVRRDNQGVGIGTALLGELMRRLATSHATELRFGSDAEHLLPGVPQEAPPMTWRLLRRAGARFTNPEYDLHLDLRTELPAAPLPDGWRLRDDDPAGGLAFVEASFPGRWAEEVADYLGAGATVFTVERSRDSGPGSSAGAQGFCVAFLGGERLTSPGLHWAGAMESEMPGGRYAGMGPLGVSTDVRGGGVGLAMVRAVAQRLKEDGVTDVIINWTTLGAFYGRLGARVWRTYQRAVTTLEDTGREAPR